MLVIFEIMMLIQVMLKIVGIVVVARVTEIMVSEAFRLRQLAVIESGNKEIRPSRRANQLNW